MALTILFKHLVAFIENEHANGSETQLLVANQSIHTSGSSNDDMWVSLGLRKHVVILRDRSSTVEYRRLNLWQILCKAGVLVLDLECQFAGVAHYEDRGLAVDRFNLLEAGENKDGSFAQTRLGLADNVGSKDRLRDADLLDCSGWGG